MTSMPPAARLGDNHVCPKVEPGPVPHVGGPVLPGCEPTVLIGNKQAARIGDPTEHGGVIVAGEATVLIGSTSQAAVLKAAARSGVPFCEECEKARQRMNASAQ